MIDNKTVLSRKKLFNETGDIEVHLRKMIGGNTTNLNDFNNMKYTWASEWYRQAMNNFWIPEEINMNLPNVGQYITANEVNLCLTIQAFQEAVHSQSYSYMLDTICSPDERTAILYQWKNDEHLLKRNKFIGDLYNEFQDDKSALALLKVAVANYILEGVYFYSGFMFFYNLGRNNKMPGSVQEIRYINRDENTHLWLFRSIIHELQKEEPQLFTPENNELFRSMIREGCEQEIAWGHYVIGDDIPGLTRGMVTDYIQYLGNLRCENLGFEPLYEGHREEPASMSWVSQYSNANLIKTDFFEAKSTAYAKSSVLKDDL